MKQAILTAPYTFELSEAPIPVIQANEVLLKVRQVGICASDMQMYHGLHKYMTFPVIFGHEAAATVVAVGSDVTDYKVGENVAIEPQVTCGECYPCRIGRFNVCEHLKVLGVHRDGFAREYVALDPKYLHHAEGLNTDETTLIEPLAVGIGSAKRAGDLHGRNVVVVGAGIIGNFAAQSAKALGAQKVMITDIKDSRLQRALDSGVDYAVNTMDKSLKAVITDTFGIQKADVIIDCAATRGSFASILEAARPSSSIVVTGNFKVPVEIEMPILQRQEIGLLGHMMYVREDYRDAISAVREKRVCLDGYATQHFSIDQTPEAFDFVDKNPDAVMKAMISLEG